MSDWPLYVALILLFVFGAYIPYDLERLARRRREYEDAQSRKGTVR